MVTVGALFATPEEVQVLALFGCFIDVAPPCLQTREPVCDEIGLILNRSMAGPCQRLGTAEAKGLAGLRAWDPKPPPAPSEVGGSEHRWSSVAVVPTLSYVVVAVVAICECEPLLQ